MKCHNCESQIESDGFSPIVVCDACHSYRFVDVPDNSANRILPLNRPGECHCPGCRRRLNQAGMDGLKVEHCATCEGVLFSSDVYEMFVRNRRGEFRQAALQPAILVSKPYQMDVKCPHCRRAMNKHPYYGPNLFVIGGCASCGMVWLDCREVALLQVVVSPSIAPARGQPVPSREAGSVPVNRGRGW